MYNMTEINIIERERVNKYNSYKSLGGKLGYWEYVNNIFNKFELDKIVLDIKRGKIK